MADQQAENPYPFISSFNEAQDLYDSLETEEEKEALLYSCFGGLGFDTVDLDEKEIDSREE